MNIHTIYLTGFMCSGKSTIGSILANTIGRDFHDLDREIEIHYGKAPADFIMLEGEDVFRQKENDLLRKLSGKTSAVIALGGGTIVNDDNLKLLKDTGVIIYLAASCEKIFQRLKFKTDRPIFRRKDEKPPELKDGINRIEQLMEKRKPYYEQADLTIHTDNASIGKTVDEIVRFIEPYH